MLFNNYQEPTMTTLFSPISMLLLSIYLLNPLGINIHLIILILPNNYFIRNLVVLIVSWFQDH